VTATIVRPNFTEYRTFEDGLKSLTGADFHDDADPGTLLDKVTGDDTTVYVWWPAGGYDTPCLAWQSPRGWSAVVVDNEHDGWFGEMWHGKVHDLGSALLGAPEPTTLLALIATACDVATNYANAKHWREKQQGLAWGLRLLLDTTEDREAADRIADDYAVTIDGKGVLNWYDPEDGALPRILHRVNLLATRAH
jgi:hypothetical protein